MNASQQRIANLAVLANLDVPADELETIANELDSIIGYMKHVQEIKVDDDLDVRLPVTNQFRQDEVTGNNQAFSGGFVQSAPSQHNGFIKVPKILP